MPKTAIQQSRAENKRTREKVPPLQKICRLYEPSDFTMIPNKPLRDKRLSLEARGLLCSIMSLPLDWSFNVAWAQREFNVGRDKLYRLIDELKAAGYVRYVRPRDSRGRLLEPSYYIAGDPRSFETNAAQPTQEPCPENPEVEASPHPDLPEEVNTTSGKSGRIQSKEEPTKETDSQKALARDFENDGGKGKEDARWWHRLHLYRQRANWPTSWGPRMHKPGCEAPARLVKLWDETKGEAFSRAEEKAERAATKRTPRTNGFAHVGTLNLPGTSHD